jgi:hypothetical protein
MMELKGKTKFGELVTLLSEKDSYIIEVVSEADEKKKKKSDKDKKEPVGIGNYKNEFPKSSVEMRGVKKLNDNETSVKLKFAGERLTLSFVTGTPYKKVVEILK